MKFVIDQGNLISLLKKGASASLSSEAQSDSTNLSRLVQAVRITATQKEIIAESMTHLIASRSSVACGNGIEVHEEGSIAVPAKQFVDWVDKQAESTIGVELQSLDTPEILRDGDIQEQSGASHGVKKLGDVSLVAKGYKSGKAKWELDGYDPDQMPDVDFDGKPDALFKIITEDLSSGIANTSFAAQPKDLNHIFDSIIFEAVGDKLYIAATDSVRCAIWHAKTVENVVRSDFPLPQSDDNDPDELDQKVGRKIMVPHALLSSVSKLLSKEGEVSFHYNADKDRAFICDGKSEYRLITTNKQGMVKVPSVARLLSANFKPLCKVDKKVLMNRLSTVSIVNSGSVLFQFNQDRMAMLAKSERSGYKPSKCVMPVDDLSTQHKAVWNLGHISDVIKVLPDDKVPFNVHSESDLLFKISSQENDGYHYFSRVVNSPIYDDQDD